MSTAENYDSYRESLPKYCLRNGTHILPAVILGYLTDESCAKLQATLKLSPIIMIVLQLIIIILVLYWTERILTRRYKDDWSGKTPSLLFTSFYFLFQVTLFKNLLAIKQSMSFVKENRAKVQV